MAACNLEEFADRLRRMNLERATGLIGQRLALAKQPLAAAFELARRHHRRKPAAVMTLRGVHGVRRRAKASLSIVGEPFIFEAMVLRDPHGSRIVGGRGIGADAALGERLHPAVIGRYPIHRGRRAAEQQAGHPLRADDRPQRRLHRAAAVGDQHDLGRERGDEAPEVAGLDRALE